MSKLLFVGNSITRHGPAPDIGWTGDWGMSASAQDKDYGHLLLQKAGTIKPDSSGLFINVADFERGFWDFDLAQYQDALDFQADIIVMRLIENTDRSSLLPHDFAAHYRRMIDYFNPTGQARVICTGSFWEDELGSGIIRDVCSQSGYPYIDLSGLWHDDSQMALGLFKHEGVARHPSDKGMQSIADLIWPDMERFLR